MNQERSNELLAKQIVEKIMDVELEYADTHGGVDYLSPDGSIALEVTAVFDGENEGAREALRKSTKKGASEAPLQGCWLVLIKEAQPRMKTFVQRVQPAIAALELAGETRFDDQRAGLHVLQQGPLSSLYRPLLEAGVEMAVYGPHAANAADPEHVHELIVSTGSGGTVGGSNEALAELLAALEPKTDNSRKLLASGAELRHLFVWLNDDTPYNIARPLERDAPSWSDEGWGVPSAAPRLDSAITHLWVVHHRSRRGWLWDGDSWRELRDL